VSAQDLVSKSPAAKFFGLDGCVYPDFDVGGIIETPDIPVLGQWSWNPAIWYNRAGKMNMKLPIVGGHEANSSHTWRLIRPGEQGTTLK
jgi:hypothetical protein